MSIHSPKSHWDLNLQRFDSLRHGVGAGVGVRRIAAPATSRGVVAATIDGGPTLATVHDVSLRERTLEFFESNGFPDDHNRLTANLRPRLVLLLYFVG